MGISKGFHVVPKETKEEVKANAFQIFNHSPRFWKVAMPPEEDAVKFIRSMAEYAIDFRNTLVHSSYLINLASPKDDVYEKSIATMIQEIRICDLLNLPFLNVHPGSHLGEGEEFGIHRIANGLNRIFLDVPESQTMILLEGVSPKGGNIGYHPHQIRNIIETVHPDYHSKLGYCYDTCHGFDAGFDITTVKGVSHLIETIRSELGWDRLKMIHLNDSKFPLNAHQDRHANIGEGTIGREGFSVFFSFKEWQDIPLILETPGDNAEHKQDIETIRGILHTIDPADKWDWMA
jgi:deoxyribonuclease-4